MTYLKNDKNEFSKELFFFFLNLMNQTSFNKDLFNTQSKSNISYQKDRKDKKNKKEKEGRDLHSILSFKFFNLAY